MSASSPISQDSTVALVRAIRTILVEFCMVGSAPEVKASSELTSNSPISPSAADGVGLAHARWWDALLHEDVAVLEKLLADDLTFHGPSGRTTTKAKYLESLRSGRLAYDSISAEEPLIRVHGATAIVTGRADILLQSEGRPQTEGLHYTAVYGWTASQWRMLAWQSTIRADARV